MCRKTIIIVVCVVTCIKHSRTNSVFPNMVLGKTEYSNAENACYIFQPLMSFWLDRTVDHY